MNSYTLKGDEIAKVQTEEMADVCVQLVKKCEYWAQQAEKSARFIREKDVCCREKKAA